AVKDGMLNSSVSDGVYTIDYSLIPYNVTVNTSGYGSASPSGTFLINHGTPTPLVAYPETGNHFLGWTQVAGDGTAEFASAADESTTVTVKDGDVTIKAMFEANDYNLTVSGINAAVTPNGVVPVAHGTWTVLSATPNEGYDFKEWTASGGTVEFSNYLASSTSVKLTTANAVVTATTAIKTFTLTVSSGANGSVSNPGSQTVNYGQTVSISATPSNSSWQFKQWNVSGFGATVADLYKASTTIKLEAGNATVTAIFEEWHGTRTVPVGVSGYGMYSIYDMKVVGDSIFVAYLRIRYSDNAPQVCFAKSTDRGVTWSTPTLIYTGSPTGMTDNGTIAIAVAESNTNIIYVSYHYDPDSNTSAGLERIRVARSANGGASFSTDTLETGYYVGRWNDVTCSSDGTRIYVSYNPGSGWSLASTYFTGTTWTSTVWSITDYSGSVTPMTSTIACAPNGSRIYAVMYDQSATNLLLAKSTNYGGTWDFYPLGSDDVYGSGADITVNDDGSWFYISYYNDTENDVRFKRGYYGHTTIWTERVISTDGYQRTRTSIARDGNTIHISYVDGNVVKYIKSTDGGGSWSQATEREITTSSSAQGIGFSGNYVYVLNGKSGLSLSKSNDGGNIW
ncbi:MAG: exo-alpha-sialidase, partial [Spirochaetaceae bacterium]|nr:exo-alpha-sialidase [Spirochaetaceae bacterium]